MSPLAQGRGLKRAVAETCLTCAASPLAQGRGLKRQRIAVCLQPLSSPLAQGRGLKLIFANAVKELIKVAPRAGAWIETWRPWRQLSVGEGSPLAQGRGLKLPLPM